MRAASIAIAYESPKLIATAIVNEGSFSELLDRRLKRIQEMEAAKLIEAKPVEAKPPQQIEAKAPLAHTPDRRFRRI
jgi:hypothetical protein